MELKKVLLVFDDPKELDFIKLNLADNGYEVFKAENLIEALLIAERVIPDLVVVNTADSETSVRSFGKQLKADSLKNVILLTLIELEDYLKVSNIEHYVVKPVRPKLLLSLIRSLMKKEEISWLASFH